MKNNNVYFITGGGTGGHIYPAVAVADGILDLGDSNKIFYVGNPNNLEASIVKDKNYTFLPVSGFGMPRKIGIELVKWVIQLFFSWIKCCYYIIKYRPKVIFGTGGYVSAPALFAAVTTGTPFVLHDCDANPGLVTRKLAPYAKSISVAFDIAKTKLNAKKCFVNGNPIRQDFAKLTKQQSREILGLENKTTICIMGGSQGAKAINTAAVKILKSLSVDNNIQILFQTGKRNYQDTLNNLKEIYPEYETDKNITVKPYFNNMAEILKACDIAVSRAGSLSISEICACGIAPIFIPYPYAAADHQRKNAKYMVENDAGLYLENDETNEKTLLNKILELVSDKKRLEDIQQNALKMAKFDAVEKIIEQLESAS